MPVRVGTDPHGVHRGASIKERPEEPGSVGERAPLFGVASDHEHPPDALGGQPGHDPVDVILPIDHTGRHVGDGGVAGCGEGSAQVQGVVDGPGRRTGHRHRCAGRQTGGLVGDVLEWDQLEAHALQQAAMDCPVGSGRLRAPGGARSSHVSSVRRSRRSRQCRSRRPPGCDLGPAWFACHHRSDR